MDTPPLQSHRETCTAEFVNHLLWAKPARVAFPGIARWHKLFEMTRAESRQMAVGAIQFETPVLRICFVNFSSEGFTTILIVAAPIVLVSIYLEVHR